MAAAAHNPEFAAKAGIPQSVAQEFNDADQAKAKARPDGSIGKPYVSGSRK